MYFSDKRAATIDHYYWLSDPLLAAWISDHLSHYGSSICELGAGSGTMLSNLMSTFSRVILTEPSVPMFQRLTNITSQYTDTSFEIKNCPAEATDLPSKVVDVILAKSCLHHFANSAAAFEEMLRLANNAVGIVEVIAPDIACLPYLRDLLIGKEPTRNPDTIFTSATLLNATLPLGSVRRLLYFDQYIDLQAWLENGELPMDEVKNLMAYAEGQSGLVREKMQMHYRSGRFVQLRRMGLLITELTHD